MVYYSQNYLTNILSLGFCDLLLNPVLLFSLPAPLPALGGQGVL